MELNDFLALQTRLFEKAVKEIKRKNPEYARNGDVLAQFKRIAEKQKVSPEKVVLIFLEKHLDAIQHQVDAGEVLPSSENFEGRLIDVINYFSLLQALSADRVEKVREEKANALAPVRN